MLCDGEGDLDGGENLDGLCLIKRGKGGGENRQRETTPFRNTRKTFASSLD